MQEFMLIVRHAIYKAVIEGNRTMSVCDEDPGEQVMTTWETPS